MDDFDTIISRIKMREGLSTDRQLADLFGITPQEFSRRKKRETLLPLIIEWGVGRSEDLNWLLTGTETSSAISQNSTHAEDSLPAEHTIEQQHMNLVRGFIDKQRALNIDKELIELEKLSPEVLKRIESYIKGSADALKTVIDKDSKHCNDRRHGERRVLEDPDQIPDGMERRSGEDRRKAS